MLIITQYLSQQPTDQLYSPPNNGFLTYNSAHVLQLDFGNYKSKHFNLRRIFFSRNEEMIIVKIEGMLSLRVVAFLRRLVESSSGTLATLSGTEALNLSIKF